MPVCLFTFHAYRSWKEDDPRGYVQRGKLGVQEPNEGLARHRASIALRDPTEFDSNRRGVLIQGARDICDRRGWRLHAASATPSHVHLLVSWKDATAAEELSATFKRLLGIMLSRHAASKGNRWFSRGGDESLVSDRGHFDYLLADYLPNHVHQNGVFWCEARK